MATDTVQLYCRPHCAKCTKVEAWLGELGLQVVVHDIGADDAALAEVERLGFRSLPVVVTADGGAALGVEPNELAAALPLLAEAARAHTARQKV